MKYLDPKADLTFKKIFGNHPARLISLLNALLPLSDRGADTQNKVSAYRTCTPAQGGKNTIVDVLCTDVRGRKFCVEMQMEWSDAFQQRVLFNASKLYVSQAKKGGKYSELQPVYSLNLVNDIFVHDTPISSIITASCMTRTVIRSLKACISPSLNSRSSLLIPLPTSA